MSVRRLDSARARRDEYRKRNSARSYFAFGNIACVISLRLGHRPSPPYRRRYRHIRGYTLQARNTEPCFPAAFLRPSCVTHSRPQPPLSSTLFSTGSTIFSGSSPSSPLLDRPSTFFFHFFSKFYFYFLPTTRQYRCRYCHAMRCTEQRVRRESNAIE